MFDVGFSEVVLIFALALVVLGPKKLPQVAATVGRWVGRARAMARQFREQLEQEANSLQSDLDLNATRPPPPAPSPAPPTPAAPGGAGSPAGANAPVTEQREHERGT